MICIKDLCQIAAYFVKKKTHKCMASEGVCVIAVHCVSLVPSRGGEGGGLVAA